MGNQKSMGVSDEPAFAQQLENRVCNRFRRKHRTVFGARNDDRVGKTFGHFAVFGSCAGLNARTLLVNIAAAADIVTETLFINVFACAFGVNVEKQV